MRAPVEEGATPLRLHRDGQFRAGLARAFGRDPAAGDVIWRRLMHTFGAVVLVYLVLPTNFFVLLPKEVVLLLALAAVLAVEVGRMAFGVELPTLRGYEVGRPASYSFYAVALVAAVLLFPPAVAVAVVLGTAFVDPLAGELRARARWARVAPAISIVAYAVLATLALALVGRWPLAWAGGLGLAAAVVGVAVEGWRLRWLDDDLTMTIAPAVLLYGVGVLALHLPA